LCLTCRFPCGNSCRCSLAQSSPKSSRNLCSPCWTPSAIRLSAASSSFLLTPSWTSYVRSASLSCAYCVFCWEEFLHSLRSRGSDFVAAAVQESYRRRTANNHHRGSGQSQAR
jgi:hypothetical protein